MTPQERRELIERPIVFWVGSHKGWGGHCVHAGVPQDGRQRPLLRPAEDGLVYARDLAAYIPEGL